MDAAGIEFVALGPADYDRAKRVLNKARHPGFVGRELFYRCATTGAAVVAVIDGQDLGVALVEKGKLGALSVVSAAQGRGVGSALVKRTAPRFVRAIVDKVPWFERLGYRAVGAAEPGKNGKMAVQLMELDGEVKATGEIGPARPATTPTKEDETLPPIGRALGLKGLNAFALKLLQQQLVEFQDRKLGENDREFLLDAIRTLGAAVKTASAPNKSDSAPAKASEKDPLATLGE